MPGLQGPALEGREAMRRCPEVPMPGMRQGLLRRLAHRPVGLEDHAGEDKIDRRNGDARIARLGDRLDLPRRRQNRAVLEG